jgi:DNA modification methylase
MIMPRLDFEGQNTLYATHGLHAFAAKCPPQLVRYGLQYYSKRGDLVLDPMVGSGTTLVECRLMSRNAVGFDLDPLSTLLAKVKSTPLEEDVISEVGEKILHLSCADLRLWETDPQSPLLDRRATPPDFHNRDYWFNPDVAAALSIISHHITKVDISENVRNFFWITFSSLILAKTSVANARDIVHSRHHYWNHKESPDVLERFCKRIKQMRKQMADFRKMCERHKCVEVRVERVDARKLPLQEQTIDLVFTSPPYATALDYPRAHFLAIPWMKNVFDLELNAYMEQAPTYIGSERGQLSCRLEIDPQIQNLTLSKQVLNQINSESAKHAVLLHRYLTDMYKTLHEIARVLKPQKHAIIVVCPSHIRKVIVPTQDILAEIGLEAGLNLKKKYFRTISNQKRILPYMQEAFGDRMSTEYVLIFQKK